MKQRSTTLTEAMSRSKLAHINSHISTMEEMNKSFHEQFGLVGIASKVAHLSNGVLSIQVGNSILLTRLRFQESSILKWAKELDSSVTQIKLSVNPSLCATGTR
ncbi:hypothetical protein J4N45_10250 [Vibrio sp. SCSIO 43140]|uniref:hypothetical protein n=1 Tax=Vibrio sp. SCSIO 43140 TaxID=2819100 RepID=UPI002075D42B|nr:hypothetical protein [Vibrio sp. SCSIO 43140]USD58910.1 hypothetical protein J4N45_10250 [Vibrio sp. SCSIO 43140]